MRPMFQWRSGYRCVFDSFVRRASVVEALARIDQIGSHTALAIYPTCSSRVAVDGDRSFMSCL
jgi:hypothetical protein